MKGKKIPLLLASLGVAAVFVGGTFAAYVITDNANPIGKKISPSEITDDKVGNITLEWGENTIANVSNLGAGVTEKMGNIVLKASGKDAQNADITSYNGTLNMKLTDLTPYGNTTPVNKLIDYLEIDVVAGDYTVEQWQGMEAGAKSAALKGHIPPAANVYSYDASVTGSSTGTTYSVFVTLSDSATPVYTTISTQVVYLQLDWNANASDANIEKTTKLFFKMPATWTGATKANIFAWKGSLVNAEFPGKEMKSEGNGLYSFELAGAADAAKFDNVIFSDDKGHQTVDTVLDYSKVYYIGGTVDGSTGKYACTSSTTKPEDLADYYVTGKINGVDNWYTSVGFVSSLAMTGGVESNKGYLELTLKAGDQICVIGSDGSYYHTQDGGDWYITEDGTYHVYLNEHSQVWVSKVVVSA